MAAARAHVDEASTLVNGFGGDVWRWVPVGGGAIQDVRHLVGALDQATAIAEIGTEVYPELMQSDSLVQDAQVDLDQLDGILTSLNQAGLHLHAAVDDLEAVDGDTPFIGDKVLEARDQAWDKIEPISTTYDEAEPVLDALPDVLGAEGDRNYIVAIMNPAELRYSGGATLTLVPMTMSDGKIEFGDTVTNEDIAAGGDGKIKWPKVKGNPFHTPGKRVVMSATFSPYWSQSGEELLRAWEARFGQKADGVITVDLQALARLMDLTGPVEAEGVGELNSGNLVKVLAGSYDFYDSEEERRAINAAVVPAFREKLFQGGQFAEKFQLLAQAAKGRHFAMYFRDSRLQEAFLKRGLAGDLSDTDHDYVGVFTQNLNSSKSDYWQTRSVALRRPAGRRRQRRGHPHHHGAEHVADVHPAVDRQPAGGPGEGPALGLLHPLGRQRDRGLPAQGRGGRGPGDDPRRAVQADRPVRARPSVLLPQGAARARRPGDRHGQVPGAQRRHRRR